MLLNHEIVIVCLRVECCLLFEIIATNYLTTTKRKLLALLKGLVAAAAHEAIDMVDVRILNLHHHLVGRDFFTATSTLCTIDSADEKKVL
jgi:hypothetical protein